MIDKDGYRANVGIILANGKGQVLFAKRQNQNAWQFPQGGIHANESLLDALYRELQEEIGLTEQDVEVVASTKHWLRYRIPKNMQRVDSRPLCIGQKQKWFLLHLKNSDDAIHLDSQEKPEFDRWQWVSYWYPINEVITFKRNVYRRAMKELCRKHSVLVEEQRV